MTIIIISFGNINLSNTVGDIRCVSQEILIIAFDEHEIRIEDTGIVANNRALKEAD